MSKPAIPRILLTGATSGIGLAMARRLWNSSYKVAITVREQSRHKISTEPFKENDRFTIIDLDINSATGRVKALDRLSKLWGGVDVLINNAAISYRSTIEHATHEDDLLQLQTNFLSPLELIRLALPHMRKQQWGRIINLSSVGGMMAMPTMGLYSASKFALEGASEALWYELKPWNVSVTLVQPGFINSESFRNVALSKKAKISAEGNDEYTPYYKHMSKFIEKLMTSAFATPDSIARKVVGLIDREYVPLRMPATIDAHFFSFIRRFMPRSFYHALLYRNLPGISQWKQNE